MLWSPCRFGGTGKKSHMRQFDAYGEEYGLHDTVGCLLDCNAGTVSFSKNGKDLGVAFTIPAHCRGQVRPSLLRARCPDMPACVCGGCWCALSAAASDSDRARITRQQSCLGRPGPAELLVR